MNKHTILFTLILAFFISFQENEKQEQPKEIFFTETNSVKPTDTEWGYYENKICGKFLKTDTEWG